MYSIDYDEGIYLIKEGDKIFKAGKDKAKVKSLVTRLNAAHRPNVEQTGENEISVCWNDHEKQEACDFVVEITPLKPFKIRVTPEQSAKVQEELFKKGFFWCSCAKNDKPLHTDVPHLIFRGCLNGNLGIFYEFSVEEFEEKKLREIDFEQFIKEIN